MNTCSFKQFLRSFSILFIAITVSFDADAIIPDRHYIRLPQECGMIYRHLDVETKDGYHIETWFFPAQEMPDVSSGQKEMLDYKVIDKKKKPVIIICNGDAGNMSYQQIDLAKVYAACGFNVVTFDWRGFGKSSDFEMDPDYLCYTEMLWDYEAVISAVRKQPETDKSNIFLFGWSTGGYLSMIAANRNKSVKGIFAIGVPSSFEDVIPQLVKVHPKGKTEENLLVPDDFPKDEMPAHIAPSFVKPIMLIVGAEDDRAPQWMAEKIINALPDKTHKKLSVFENTGHGGMRSPYITDPDRFFEETVTFLYENF